MAHLVDVPAKKALIYQGRSYVRGELVPMRPIDAAIAARRGDVSLTRHTRHRQMEVEADPEPEPALRSRRYRRRDMVPEEP